MRIIFLYQFNNQWQTTAVLYACKTVILDYS